jgi:hypothetical protein
MRVRHEEVPDMNADPGAAHAVARGLALGQIQSMAECANDFRHSHPAAQRSRRHWFGRRGTRGMIGFPEIRRTRLFQ